MYNGEVQKPAVKKAVLGGKKLDPASDYDVCYSNKKSTRYGTYYVWIAGKGAYQGMMSAKRAYKIKRAPNPLNVKAKSPAVAYKKLKRAAQKIKASACFKVVRNAGAGLTYEKVSGSAALSVSRKGVVTVAKNTRKGTYKMKVKAVAPVFSDFKSATDTVTLRVRVK